MGAVLVLLILYILVNGHFLPFSEWVKEWLNLILLIGLALALFFLLL